MKRILTLTILLFFALKSFAQTDGISYQAVIIGPDDLELPGVDSEGNYLPSTMVDIRFTIFDSGNQLEFQEVQTTTTDEFGRINLIIGAVEHDDFEKISWDGTPKDLKVDIDFKNGDSFVDMSREILTFVPYAYHRNITATGTLDVDDDTFLNRELTVNGPTNLNSTLYVNDGNETNLSGDLTVDGETNLNDTFNVNNKSTSYLSGALIVGDSLDGPPDGDLDAPTILNGSLTVVGESTFTGLVANELTINNSTELNGSVQINSEENQVKITSAVNGNQFDINNYPLLVEGGNQGIAIKVDAVGAKNANNFISFWDNTPPSANLREPAYDGGLLSDAIIDLFGYAGIGVFDIPTTNDVPTGNTTSYETVPNGGPMMWGRIEGETDENEFTNNADYNMDKLAFTYDKVDGSLDLIWQSVDVIIAGIDWAGSSADVRPCVGFGACVVSPGPAQIAADAASFALEVIKELAAIGNEAFAFRNYNVFLYHKRRFKGVSYASGAGDYAEYLMREQENESMSYGDVVGVVGGKISKNTKDASRIMVISYKPAVLGALPQPHLEKFYEKVAFMGQVPVKVYGKVNIGDYILPSGKNDGMGVAVSPSEIKLKDVKKIVGVAWESVDQDFGFNYVNVAVGLNSNDTSPFIERIENKLEQQTNELNSLKKLLEETIQRLAEVENGAKNPNGLDYRTEEIPDVGVTSDGRNYTVENDIMYFEITDADIEKGLELAEEMMQKEGINTSKHIVWNKIKKDVAFKNKLKKSIKEKLEKSIHYHKDLNEKK